MLLLQEDNLASRQIVMQRAVLFSVVTVLVLVLFQPFGTYNDAISYKFLRLSGYGLATFCALLFAGMLEITLLRVTIAQCWRRVLIPIIYLICIAVANHSYFVVAVLGSWLWQNQLLFIFYVLAIGLFPIIFMVVVNRHGDKITAQKYAAEPLKNNDVLSVGASQSLAVVLTGDNKNDQLTVTMSDLLFIKSADNYCELVIVDTGEITYKLLRSSLINVLTQLPKNTSIHRCHRSYAVNLLLVQASNGNAAGLQLSFKSTDITVPVSRSHVSAIKEALSFIPSSC
ncbi:MAG: LytTR family transcriptional regulator [Psychrobium sp.]|nr:LytTR family transcriptional regulator [Psychrobium sp.]